MDASQPPTSNAGPPEDVEMTQGSTQHTEASTSTGEQPLLPATASIATNPKPKRAPKAAPNADRPPGKSLLPIARVQRIMKADKELTTCAKEAVFLISVATEEFIKRLGKAGQQQAMREKRTTVQRRDVVTAVRRSDEFVFLEEIMASEVPAAPAVAPGKRKTKTTAPANDSRNMMETFVRGKERATLGPDTSVGGDEGKRPYDGHEIPDSGVEKRDSALPSHGNFQDTQPTQGERQGDGDEMDMRS